MDSNLRAKITNYQEQLFKALEMMPPLQPGKYSLVVDGFGTVFVGPVEENKRVAELEQALRRAREIIVWECGALDPEEPWEFIDEVLKETPND